MAQPFSGVAVRMEKKQITKLEKMAKGSGVSVSGFIRDLIEARGQIDPIAGELVEHFQTGLGCSGQEVIEDFLINTRALFAALADLAKVKTLPRGFVDCFVPFTIDHDGHVLHGQELFDFLRERYLLVFSDVEAEREAIEA